MKKVILVLIVVALIAVSAAAFARYSDIATIAAGLSLSGSTANVTGEVSAQDIPSAVSVVVRLEQKTGESWSTVTSWTKSSTMSALAGGTYTLPQRGTYRTKTIGTVNSETATKLSGEKTW